MKTKKTLVTIFAVAVSVIAMATEKPKTNVHSLDDEKVLVTMQAEQASKMEVTIEDQYGNIVYYKQTKNPVSTYTKIFNLKELKKGNYMLTVKVNDLATTRELAVNGDRITVGKASESVAPFFTFVDNRLILAHLNFENENYRIEIYGNEGLVHKSTVGNNPTISARFDLSQVEDGQYQVFLNSANHDYNYRFVKK